MFFSVSFLARSLQLSSLFAVSMLRKLATYWIVNVSLYSRHLFTWQWNKIGRRLIKIAQLFCFIVCTSLRLSKQRTNYLSYFSAKNERLLVNRLAARKPHLSSLYRWHRLALLDNSSRINIRAILYCPCGVIGLTTGRIYFAVNTARLWHNDLTSADWVGASIQFPNLTANS